MKEEKQKISDKEKGDCFRACLASILEIKNDDSFVVIDTKNWLQPYFNVLGKMGLRLNFDKDAIWRNGYWIASVPSLNFKNTTHAIVMFGDKVAFDPNIKKKYRKGMNILGKDIVKFGYWVEVSDFGKLKKYTRK